MACVDSDILVELTKDEMFELKENYKKVKEAFYVYTLIDQTIRWLEKPGEKAIVVTSPNNTWREDGSIVILFKFGLVGVFPYSLDATYRNVCEGLLKTKRISGQFFFFNIHESYFDIVQNLIRDMNRKVLCNYENFLYAISIEKALAFKTDLPAGIYLKKLNKTNAKRVNELWPHRCEDSEKIVELCLEVNVGIGLFTNENELAAWVLQGNLGHIQLLQTEEHHKRKGYGNIMLQIMAKNIAERGHIPVATVLTKNTASNGLFEKLGFKKLGKSYFIVTDII